MEDGGEAAAAPAQAAPPPAPAADTTPAAQVPAPQSPEASTTPPVGARAYRPTFLQQHVKEYDAASPSPFSYQGAHAYQGVKPNIGADSFMLQHTKQTSPGSSTASRSYQGVKPTIGADTYVQAELKRARDNLTPPKKRELKPHIGGDSLLTSFARKQQAQQGHASSQFNPLGGEKAARKPTIGADSMMSEFARKQQQSQQHAYAFNRVDGGDRAKPHVNGDAFVAAQLRVTKAQTPSTTRAYQGVKPNVGADSFHMAFLNSIKSWSKTKESGKEVRL
jgi:hypothetical protein